MTRLILFLCLFTISIPSYSYLGPGMSGGAIAAIMGFLAAIVLGIWGILYYPIKRAIKNMKNKKIVMDDTNNEL